MVSEIKIGVLEADKKAVYVITNARVTNVADPYEGVSQKTGEKYKIVNFNIELNLGEGVKRNYMRVTAFTRVAEWMTLNHIGVNSIVNLYVDFNVSGKFPTTEIRVVDIKLAKE